MRAALTALLLAAAARPAPAAAASKADAFEGRIQPISGQLYRKAGRFELTLAGATSLNDAFYKKYLGTLRAGYHLTEFLSASAAYSLASTARTGSDTVCPANQGCHPASPVELHQVPGKLERLASLELAWTPVYGKLNLLAEQVAHFDLGLLVGADWVTYGEVLSSTAANAIAGGGPGPRHLSTVGGHVGLGVRFFLGEALALRWEVKDLVYAVKVPNLSETGRAGRDVQNQLLTEVGLTVFFPLSPRPAGGTP
jgi:outer membrane beta-barrel protein